MTHVSILGNRLTCHAVGNPPPSVKWSTPSGLVIENQTTLFLGQDSTYNGRYSCLATSSLKPDSISTLDVQKARDLRKFFADKEILTGENQVSNVSLRAGSFNP